MRLTLFLTLVVALVLAGLLGLERRLPGLVREQLVEFGYDDLLTFEGLELPAPERIVVRGAGLRDLRTGELTAWVERLELELDDGLAEGRAPELLAIRGYGGRALLRQDATGSEMTFVTALVELIDRIIAEFEDDPAAPAEPADDDEATLPPMVFEDLLVTVHAPGQPLTRLSGVRTTIVENTDTTDVVVDPPGPGELRMAFDMSGMRSLIVDDMQADPALIHIIPEVGPFLSELLQPTGRVDVTVLVDTVVTPEDPDGEIVVSVDGTARNLVVRSPYVPVPMGPMVTRFRYADDELHVEDALVQLPGGSLRASLTGPLTGLRATFAVREAEFRRWMVDLVPGLRDVELLQLYDGGAFDLDLELDGIDLEGDGIPRVRGRGGFHVRHAEILTPGVPLELEDVVGRFQIDDVELIIPVVSARVAGGNMTAEGVLLLDALTYDTTVRVEDVDVGPLHPSLHAGCTCEHTIRGWLQGEATLYGVLDGVSLPRLFGQASIRAADLWDTPLVEAILLALPDDVDGPRDRQRVQASFTYEDELVTLDSIRIESEVFTLTAEDATIDADRNISMDASVFQVPFGIVGKAVQLLADQLLLRVEIRGDLDAPRVTPVPLPVVTGPIRSLVRGIADLFSSDAEGPVDPGAGPDG